MISMRITRPEQTPSGETTEPRSNRPTRCAALAAAGVCLVAVTVTSCGGDGEGLEADPSDAVLLEESEPSEGARSDPAAAIEEYRIAYNSGDLERMMALFSDDSVLTGHPFAASSTGLVAIRSVQLRDLSAAAPSDAYEMFNVEVTDDTVTWDHQFTNAGGERWCAEGNTAVVAAGKIESWAFAPSRRRC